MGYRYRYWHRVAIVAAAKTLFPFYGQVRRFKRALSPYQSNPGNDEGLVGSVLRQIAALREAGIGIEGKTVVEIGSGWVPITPLIFRMAGAGKVVTVDVERLMDQETFLYAAKFVREHIAEIAARVGFDLSTLAHRAPPDFAAGRLEDLLAEGGIEYLAPRDVRDLADGSADIVVSCSVLEHIAPSVLEGIFARCRKILRTGGAMVHSIDFTDHFAQYDKSISQLNFLQYEDSTWKWTHICHQFYMNRLRLFEMVALLEDTGFQVKSVVPKTNDAARAAIATMKVSSRFANIPVEELAILNGLVVAV